MRLIAFPQWDKLMSLLRGMARQSAAVRTHFPKRVNARLMPSAMA